MAMTATNTKNRAIRRCPTCHQKHLGRCGPVVSVVAEELSYRENQILYLLCEGKSNLTMAEELGVAAQTIKQHLTNIYDKCGKYSRLQIALHYNQTILSVRISALQTELEQERQINSRLKQQLEREFAINNALVSKRKG